MLNVPRSRGIFNSPLRYWKQPLIPWKQVGSSSASRPGKGGFNFGVPMDGELDYSQWSPDKLVELSTLLEGQLRELRVQTAKSALSPSTDLDYLLLMI